MSTTDERQTDQNMIPLILSYDEIGIDALAELNTESCTMKDVARLAGVSTAPVSRVTNGASNVSGNAKTKVLAAISTLKYRPNTHAAELGHANAGIRRNRDLPMSIPIRREGRADL
jgi:Bacterial regulatory proteins, lacI family